MKKNRNSLITQVVIVVPVYKKVLNNNEKVSLEQLFRLMSHYDICFVAPYGLKTEYLRLEKVEYFSPDFFISTQSYNRLMLSKEFYERFHKYTYMLLYQLDAFVFSDRLMEFVQMNYDYIGAPWLGGTTIIEKDIAIVVYVGNGGFSLRNIPNTIKLLERKKEEIKFINYNEDAFFGKNGSELFRVAPMDVALAFSFEKEVKKCFSLCHNNLPMGCHAWEKYDFDAWKDIFRQNGYELDIQDGQGDLDNKEQYKIQYRKSAVFSLLAKVNRLCIANRKICIYGAGLIGRNVYKLIKNEGFAVDCFIDSKIKDSIYDCKILDLEQLVIHSNTMIVICASDKNILYFAKRLKNIGLEYGLQYLFYYDIVYSEFERDDII